MTKLRNQGQPTRPKREFWKMETKWLQSVQMKAPKSKIWTLLRQHKLTRQARKHKARQEALPSLEAQTLLARSYQARQRLPRPQASLKRKTLISYLWRHPPRWKVLLVCGESQHKQRAAKLRKLSSLSWSRCIHRLIIALLRDFQSLKTFS